MNQIVAQRDQDDQAPGREQRPTMEELAAGAWFEPVRTESWRWSIELSSQQVGRLFKTFSNWSASEAAAAEQAAEDLGGRVTEHDRSILARRVEMSSRPRSTPGPSQPTVTG